MVKRLEWLDANFLAAVNAFLAVPGVTSNPELTGLLQTIRQETLQLVRGLPLRRCLTHKVLGQNLCILVNLLTY